MSEGERSHCEDEKPTPHVSTGLFIPCVICCYITTTSHSWGNRGTGAREGMSPKPESELGLQPLRPSVSPCLQPSLSVHAATPALASPELSLSLTQAGAAGALGLIAPGACTVVATDSVLAELVVAAGMGPLHAFIDI